MMKVLAVGSVLTTAVDAMFGARSLTPTVRSTVQILNAPRRNILQTARVNKTNSTTDTIKPKGSLVKRVLKNYCKLCYGIAIPSGMYIYSKYPDSLAEISPWVITAPFALPATGYVVYAMIQNVDVKSVAALIHKVQTYAELDRQVVEAYNNGDKEKAEKILDEMEKLLEIEKEDDSSPKDENETGE